MNTSQTNLVWKLVALLVTLVGLGCFLYGLYGLLLRRPVVPPGVPPLTEVPLLGPRQRADLWTHGFVTTTTLSDVSEISPPAVSSPPPPPEVPKPKKLRVPPKVLSAPKQKPMKTRKPTQPKPSPPERPRERVPSAFEQLMRSRAARAQGVSLLPLGLEAFLLS